MKVCKTCEVEKDLSFFYKHKQMADGYLNICKECTKKRVGKHRELNIDTIMEYDRNRPNAKERVKLTKERKVKLKEDDPELYCVLEYNRIRQYREQNPNKQKAHSAVNNAVRDNRLIRPDECEVCSCKCTPHGHHESYEEEHWLDVVWLCIPCHAARHKELNKIKREELK